MFELAGRRRANAVIGLAVRTSGAMTMPAPLASDQEELTIERHFRYNQPVRRER
jgi:hypothetical protein